MSMQKSVLVIGAAGVALTLGCSALAQASDPLGDRTGTSSGSAHSGHPRTERRFVLIDHTGPTRYDDVGRAGISVGDSFVFSESLTRHGTKVGTAGGTCTEVEVNAKLTSQQCVITATLPRGHFTVAGIATYQRSAQQVRPVHYAIVGGTGAFRTARGQVSVTNLSQTSDRIAVHLITR